jgi:hypothetical protein
VIDWRVIVVTLIDRELKQVLGKRGHGRIVHWDSVFSFHCNTSPSANSATYRTAVTSMNFMTEREEEQEAFDGGTSSSSSLDVRRRREHVPSGKMAADCEGCHAG